MSATDEDKVTYWCMREAGWEAQGARTYDLAYDGWLVIEPGAAGTWALVEVYSERRHVEFATLAQLRVYAQLHGIEP